MTGVRTSGADALVVTAVLSAALLTTATAGVGLVLEPDVVGIVALVGVLAAQAVALLRRMSGTPPRSGWTLAPPTVLVCLAAMTLLSVPLLAPLGVSRGWETWAWVGAGLVGSAPFVLGWRAGVAAAVALTGVSACVGQWLAGSPWTYALLTAGTGGTLILVHLVPLRLGRLVVEAQTGRDAAARLAAADERLRFAADVHDLLGHHLTVIALAAELAARTARTDPDAAAGHAERARESAATALTEMRRVVHGYRETDLPAQLEATAQVLRASGIRTTVEIRHDSGPDDGASETNDISTTGHHVDLPQDAAAALAAVAREAGTNVLRHGRARWCTIELVHTAAGTELTVTNEAPRAAPDRDDEAAADEATPGAVATGPAAPDESATRAATSGADPYSSGLAGLRDRVAACGGTLHTGLDDAVFTLRATVPS